MSRLYTQSATDITLLEAIKSCAAIFKNGTALLYSPQSCQFAQIDANGNMLNSQEQIIDLDSQKNNIFEARIFDNSCELRWLNESQGKGKAVLISEQELGNILTTTHSQPFVEKIVQQYLLWGEKTNSKLTQGWQRLATARIGALDVPIAQILIKQRVYLKAIEYLAKVDDYGNVAVIEERLLKLEVK